MTDNRPTHAETRKLTDAYLADMARLAEAFERQGHHAHSMDACAVINATKNTSDLRLKDR